MVRVGVRSRGQTATEYMLIISVVVIAVVAAAFQFVPAFQEGVMDLGQDVKQALSSGDLRGTGGSDMGSGPSVRVSSRLCDGSDPDPRYDAMFAPPPCAALPPPAWRPSAEPSPIRTKLFVPRAPASVRAATPSAPTHIPAETHVVAGELDAVPPLHVRRIALRRRRR